MFKGAALLVRGALRAAGDGALTKVSYAGPACTSVLARRGFADDASLKKTPLYDYHVANGGETLAALWTSRHDSPPVLACHCSVITHAAAVLCGCWGPASACVWPIRSRPPPAPPRRLTGLPVLAQALPGGLAL